MINRLLSKVSFFLSIFLVVLPLIVTAETSSANLMRISELLDHGQNQKAYQLASNIGLNEVGSSTYDLLLGRSALAVGKYDEALLSFRRVVMEDPSNVMARFFLAKTYYELGVYKNARKELRYVPPGFSSVVVTNRIQELSDKIEQKINPYAKPFCFYGGLSFGYDNNVAGSADGDYNKYLGILFDSSTQISGLDVDAKSMYLYPQIGIGGENIVSAKTRVFWDLNLSHKDYTDVGGYNISQGNIMIGVDRILSNLYMLNANFYYQEYLVNVRRYRELPILAFKLRRYLNDSNMLSVYTNLGILSYPNNRQSDVNMYVGGLEWFYHDDENSIVTQLYCGQDRPRGRGEAWSGNTSYGIDILAKRRLVKNLDFLISGNLRRAIYDVEQKVNVDIRRDTYRKFSTGLHYKFHPNCTYYVLGSYVNNSSSIFYNKYDRLEFWTGVSFNF